MKVVKGMWLKILPKCLMLLFCSIHYVLKRKIDIDYINHENPEGLNI